MKGRDEYFAVSDNYKNTMNRKTYRSRDILPGFL